MLRCASVGNRHAAWIPHAADITPHKRACVWGSAFHMSVSSPNHRMTLIRRQIAPPRSDIRQYRKPSRERRPGTFPRYPAMVNRIATSAAVSPRAAPAFRTSSGPSFPQRPSSSHEGRCAAAKLSRSSFRGFRRALVAPAHKLMQGEGDFVGMQRAPDDDALELDGIVGDAADFHQLGFDDLRVSHEFLAWHTSAPLTHSCSLGRYVALSVACHGAVAVSWTMTALHEGRSGRTSCLAHFVANR